MRTLCALLILGRALFGGVCLSAQAQSTPTDSLSSSARLDTAQAAWRADRPSVVISLLRPLATTDTASATVYELLGRSHQALRQHEAARTALQRALEQGGQSASLLTALGKSNQAEGRLAQAEQAQRRALSVDTTGRSRHLRLRLADVLMERRRWDRAADLYRLLLSADSTDVFVRKRLAHAEAERGRPDAARRHYRSVHRQQPHDAAVARSLTRLLSDREQYTAALAVTRRTLKHRDWPDLWRRHGDLAFQVDSLAMAERAYENAVTRGDSAASTLQRLGIVRVGQNKAADALSPLRTSYRHDSTRAATSFYLGTAYRGVDSLDQSIAAYEQAVDQASTGTLTDALLQLAPAHDETGHLPRALNTYRLVLRLQPERTEVYFHLAALYDEHYKDKTVAAKYYHRFLNQHKNSAPRLKEYARHRLKTLQPTLHRQRGRTPPKP